MVLFGTVRSGPAQFVARDINTAYAILLTTILYDTTYYVPMIGAGEDAATVFLTRAKQVDSDVAILFRKFADDQTNEPILKSKFDTNLNSMGMCQFD